eukprot:6636017-Ditylum_brightwellii.AAC.1
MNDDHSAAVSHVSCYMSITSDQSRASMDNMMSPTKRIKKDFHGNNSMNVMFVLDEWTDSM